MTKPPAVAALVIGPEIAPADPTAAPKDPTAAARNRLARQRRKLGVVVIRPEVVEARCGELIDGGYLPARKADDRKAVGAALREFNEWAVRQSRTARVMRR